jgi:RNA polymerase sigma-70 factor (ECF subfamily)
MHTAERLQDDSCADVQLIQRMVERDQTALGELYDRYGRLLFSLIQRILGDRSEAEEVLQEVFVQAWTRCGTYDATLGSVVGWLVRVARNRAIDRLRANGVRGRTIETTPLEVTTPESHAWNGERARAVMRALNGLPPEQRLLIEQAYFEGLTQSELAARHQLPLGTVKTRMRMGLQALRGELGQAFIGS